MFLKFKKNRDAQHHRTDTWLRSLISAVPVILLVVFGSLSSCVAATVEEKMQQSVMINPHPLGDARNSASVPYTAQLKGEILWKSETTQKNNPLPARQLAIKDDFLVVGYGPFIGLHQRASGQAVWSWQIGSNCKFQMTSEGLATVDHAGFYRILHFDKSLSEPLSLPFLDDQTVLFFIAQTGDEFRYCFALMPLPTNSPDDIKFRIIKFRK